MLLQQAVMRRERHDYADTDDQAGDYGYQAADPRGRQQQVNQAPVLARKLNHLTTVRAQ